jgi:hypothetical protein
MQDKSEPLCRHYGAVGDFPTEAGRAVEEDDLRSGGEAVTDEGVEHGSQVGARGRGHVDDQRIRRPGQAGSGTSVVPDDPDAGSCRGHRRPRAVGAKQHIGPTGLGSHNRGSDRRVGLDDLQRDPSVLRPKLQSGRPAPSESGQRP